MFKLHQIDKHKSECKEKLHEMREKLADETSEKAHNFITGPAKKYKRGY